MRSIFGFVTLAMLPVLAQAEGFDYTYVEVGYVSADFDAGGLNVDGDGFGVNGSFAINDDYHLFAEYSSLGFDFSVDLHQLAVGAGVHFELSPTIDFVGTFAYLDAEVDTGFGSVSDNGFGIGAGVRGAVNNTFEWEAGVDYADVDGSSTSFRLDGRYYFTETVAGGAGISFDDDVTIFALGVRVEFGQ
jgi:hypothetical protein